MLVGVVMMQGWPIAHQVFAGNRPDQATLLEVVADLRSRFGLQRVVWVGDRGMVTLGNLEQLRQAGQGYLMGLQRRNRQDIADYIEEALAKDGWQECEVGITASEKAQPPRTRVQEVAGKRQGSAGVRGRQRVAPAVRAGARRGGNRREQARERVREQLERLQQRVEREALKQPEKIGAAAAAILGWHHGHRYFQWELRQGKFHYAAHEVNFAREQLLEGKYVIQTEERDLTPLEAVAAYKELNEVERGFAQLKGLLQVRPVYHRRDERVRAHIFVAALAFLLDRALEKKLRAAGSGLSSAAAWRALETVRVVELELGQRRKRCVTRGSRQAAEVLRVLGLRQQLDPPPPPAGRETIM